MLKMNKCIQYMIYRIIRLTGMRVELMPRIQQLIEKYVLNRNACIRKP